jgi:hypothetical protein
MLFTKAAALSSNTIHFLLLLGSLTYRHHPLHQPARSSSHPPHILPWTDSMLQRMPA